ncbi:methyl-accepting chemotaxis protein [Cytobacillus sp. Hz8]|uniref:methyl-accepting chemotaxis protein n=1 Tax=Cytobacillus sp. Hz8 TaxID=3347168 RepID=UPI0035DF36A0
MSKNLKLGTKITLSIMLSMLIILLITVFILLKNTNNAVESTISNSSVQTARNIAKSIDPNVYSRFMQAKQETDDYWALREQINDYRIKSGAIYAYTLEVDQNNKVHMIVDGLPRDSKISAKIGDLTTATTYQDVAPVLKGKTNHTEIVHDPEYGDYLSAFAPIKDESGKIIGILGVDIDAKSVASIQSTVTKDNLPFFLSISVIAIILANIFLYFYVKRQLRVLPFIGQTATEIAEGNLKGAQEIVNTFPKQSNRDITLLAEDFKRMTHNTISMIQNISITANKLIESFNHLHQSFLIAEESNKNISLAVKEVAENNSVQSERSKESSVAVEEMATGIQKIAESATAVSESSIGVNNELESGNAKLTKLSNQMDKIQGAVLDSSSIIKELGEQASGIEVIVKTISAIADQTNLLALNAAIEAARAGEHGKGFAVVADEVRKLAEQSKESAEQINQLIKNYQSVTIGAVNNMEKGLSEVEMGSKAVEEVNITFNKIFKDIRTVNDEIQSTSAITEEMSATTEEVAASVEEFFKLSQVTTDHSVEVASSADEQIQSLKEMNQYTAELQTLAKELEATINRFTI